MYGVLGGQTLPKIFAEKQQRYQNIYWNKPAFLLKHPLKKYHNVTWCILKDSKTSISLDSGIKVISTTCQNTK